MIWPGENLWSLSIWKTFLGRRSVNGTLPLSLLGLEDNIKNIIQSLGYRTGDRDGFEQAQGFDNTDKRWYFDFRYSSGTECIRNRVTRIGFS